MVVESSPSPEFRIRGVKNHKKGTDVCSNEGAKHETRGTYFKCGAGTTGFPLATVLCRISIQSCYFCVLDVEML